MRPVLTAAQMREVDARESARVGEARLIERAAFAVANVAIELLGGAYGRHVVVLAGSGHNGADAVRAGALLARRGAQVSIVRSSDKPGDEHVAAAWHDAVAAGARERSEPAACDLVLDGMVGIGSRGALEGRPAQLADAVRHCTTVAVDIPSGVDADTGAVGVNHNARQNTPKGSRNGGVRADVTVTFGALKPGLLVGAGAELAGQVVLAPIGFAPIDSAVSVLDAIDAAKSFPEPPRESDKRTRGVVGVVAGSDSYPGAGILVVGGAVRAGAGYVRAPGAPAEVLAAFPSAVAADGRCDVWVGGSGVDAARGHELRQRWDGEEAFVLDATGLDIIGAAGIRGRAATTVITPHAQEFQKLTGIDPHPDPLGAALQAAADLECVVVLKGSTTIVAAPDGQARLVLTPSSWLATAGTGDVLSGVIGATLAAALKRQEPVLEAVSAAVFLHGLAGRFAAARDAGEAAIAADDLLAWLGEAAASIRSVL